MTTQVLYNPLANNGKGAEGASAITPREGESFVLTDLCGIADLAAFLQEHKQDERLIIAGGDGTLNRFVNALGGKCPDVPLYYYPCGSGNDFARDIPQEEWQDGLIPLSRYIRDLPCVTVNGRTEYFINGIGYGIDGYCCEEGDRKRARSSKPVNYTAIAISGLLFHFKPRNAEVTVDGTPYKFRKVWLAPAMHGRYYGGGMKVAPEQDRLCDGEQLTLVVMYGSGKLKTLTVFPSIFEGKHVAHTEMVTQLAGKQITVRFDRPTALQIDGETVLGVTEYTVCAAKAAQMAEAVPQGQAE